MVADGHEPARKFVTTFVQDQGLRVVGQAADGKEAVRLCKQLRPGVVVLNTYLPMLNGFDAARKIAKLSPDSKIIFLSLDNLKMFSDEALRIGGVGFVFMDRIVSDLPVAIEAVLEGKTYVSGQN